MLVNTGPQLAFRQLAYICIAMHWMTNPNVVRFPASLEASGLVKLTTQMWTLSTQWWEKATNSGLVLDVSGDVVVFLFKYQLLLMFREVLKKKRI